jgi:hypothetical protein
MIAGTKRFPEVETAGNGNLMGFLRNARWICLGMPLWHFEGIVIVNFWIDDETGKICINTDIKTAKTVSRPSINPSKTGGIRIVSSCAHP